MGFKVTFIGAGSLIFARTLFTDIMSVPEFQKDIEVAFITNSFFDCNRESLVSLQYIYC